MEKLQDHQERNLVIDTSQGLVLTDPFHPKAARQLKILLDKKFPKKSVHSLIYTHYHLDHVRGGGILNPQQIIAHKKCSTYWNEWKNNDILKPTLSIDGDYTLQVGQQNIELLYLGRTHSDTNIAVYLPQSKVLFTGDLGFVRTFAPMGFPDHEHQNSGCPHFRTEQATPFQSPSKYLFPDARYPHDQIQNQRF